MLDFIIYIYILKKSFNTTHLETKTSITDNQSGMSRTDVAPEFYYFKRPNLRRRQQLLIGVVLFMACVCVFSLFFFFNSSVYSNQFPCQLQH